MRVLRAADRFVTAGEGIRTAHCFSFGAHFDPANTGFGPLLACNDEHLAPGAGYPAHAHADTEIVTWVAAGRLTHEDSTGRRHELPAGSVQRLSAGRGVRHVERNDGGTPLRFVQMWLRPDVADAEPTYACGRPEVAAAVWTDVAGGTAGGLLTGGAVLRVARAGAGAVLRVPDAPRCHLFVVDGGVSVDGAGLLLAGDSLRLEQASPRLQVPDRAELLAWALPAGQTPAR